MPDPDKQKGQCLAALSFFIRRRRNEAVLGTYLHEIIYALIETNQHCFLFLYGNCLNLHEYEEITDIGCQKNETM